MRLTTGSKFAAAALVLMPLLSGCGDTTDVDSPTVTNIAGNPPLVPPLGNPSVARNNSFVSVSGTVSAAIPNGFILDYGPGTIMIEMDDWDLQSEARAVKVGDSVVVNGSVDRDLWEKNTIEAGVVYVRDLNAYFYANSADEELTALSHIFIPRPGGFSDAMGYVTAIEGREITIGSGESAVRIDTAKMADNPVDDTGARRIKVGDRIYAYGLLEIDPVERAELMATDIVSLVSAGNASTNSVPVQNEASARASPAPSGQTKPTTPAATATP